MVLTALLAVAMLSLGSVASRGSRHANAHRLAQSNARLALMQAIGELQKSLGDDRRITADASLLMSREDSNDPSPGSAMLGVWESDYSSISEDRNGGAPDYSGRRDDKFLRWLISSRDTLALESTNFRAPEDAEGAARLFSESADGFDLYGELVDVGDDKSKQGGGFAWAITQNGTKAQINVGGDRSRSIENDALQSPTRPNVETSGFASQPDREWNKRRSRLVSMSQVQLDSDFGINGSNYEQFARSYTTSSYGIQADVTKGGLRKDLSLAFELEDSQFHSDSLAGVTNPFRSSEGEGSEKPIFQPINDGTPVTIDVNYEAFKLTNEFKTGAPPTFDSLRSHYRIYKHLYQSNGDTTIMTRTAASPYYEDGNAPRGSETSIQPVLDRMLMYLSLWVDPSTQYMNLVFTPVITLWNPYNVAIETDGMVAYPWMDLPMTINWTVRGGSTVNSMLTWFIGNEHTDQNHGRQEFPYFYFEMTESGDGNTNRPIHLEPGEVRVFSPVDPTPVAFQRLPKGTSEPAKYKLLTCRLKPVGSGESVDTTGGIAVPMNDSFNDAGELSTKFAARDVVSARFTMDATTYHYFVALEDSSRIKGAAEGNKILDAQVYKGRSGNSSTFNTPQFRASELSKPQPVGVLETFHRTAGQDDQIADIVYTVNPQQRYVNVHLSNTSGMSPHYESSMRGIADFSSSNFQTTMDGERSFYGESNSSSTGRDHLSFFGLPDQAPISLGAFQHANVMDTAFGPANTIGNSWASPYISRSETRLLQRKSPADSTVSFKPRGLGSYDGSYLINNVLWDGYFLSSISPEVQPGNSATSWNQTAARETRELDEVIRQWVEEPLISPLRNPRNTLYKGSYSEDQVIDRLTQSGGFANAAAHILTEGSFNVNSTNVEAWKAVLASLRGQEFKTYDGDRIDPGNSSPLSRFTLPTGSANDQWDGFRQLSDKEVGNLAEAIVEEVRSRGPFFSLGDFVNRRLTRDEKGLKGALQAAIDSAGLNDNATVASFTANSYPESGNIPDADTGVGTPGWLTQADVLNSLAPVMSVRSDTYTVRAYGEAHDQNGKVVARACYEAVVQRVPDWTDPSNKPEDEVDSLSQVNQRFGRRFQIVSQREIPLELLRS